MGLATNLWPNWSTRSRCQRLAWIFTTTSTSFCTFSHHFFLKNWITDVKIEVNNWRKLSTLSPNSFLCRPTSNAPKRKIDDNRNWAKNKRLFFGCVFRLRVFFQRLFKALVIDQWSKTRRRKCFSYEWLLKFDHAFVSTWFVGGHTWAKANCRQTSLTKFWNPSFCA